MRLQAVVSAARPSSSTTGSERVSGRPSKASTQSQQIPPARAAALAEGASKQQYERLRRRYSGSGSVQQVMGENMRRICSFEQNHEPHPVLSLSPALLSDYIILLLAPTLILLLRLAVLCLLDSFFARRAADPSAAGVFV